MVPVGSRRSRHGAVEVADDLAGQHPAGSIQDPGRQFCQGGVASQIGERLTAHQPVSRMPHCPVGGEGAGPPAGKDTCLHRMVAIEVGRVEGPEIASSQPAEPIRVDHASEVEVPVATEMLPQSGWIAASRRAVDEGSEVLGVEGDLDTI